MVGRLLAHNIARGPAAFGGDDLSDANLPPPSTLAAQLVRNHVDTARGLNQPDTTVTFRQLLQEILNKTSVPETDVDVNLKNFPDCSPKPSVPTIWTLLWRSTNPARP